MLMQMPQAPQYILHWKSKSVGLTNDQPVRVLKIRHNNNFNPRHEHHFWEIVIIESGQAIHETDIGAQNLKSGQAVIIRPGAYHSFRSTKNFKILNCVILPSVFNQELRWMTEERAIGQLLYGSTDRGQLGPVVIDCQKICIRQCLGILATIAQNRAQTIAPASRAVMISRVATVIGELAEQWARQQTASHGPIVPAVRRAIETLSNDLSRPWQMQDLSKQVNCSMAYLTRLFTAAMNIPPMAYLTQLRLERASVLLRRTPLPIAKIADTVGYPNPEHFSRRFHQQYLITPSAYRRHHQKIE